jgi:acyl CoA:acetate/3-ketoacid CoA transferase beta subunit
MSGVTRAEIVAVACAELFRGDGEIVASSMGLVPSLGARLARLTFEPDLLLSDGEAYLLANTPGLGSGEEPVIEGWQPFRKVLDTVVPRGNRHVVMGANQIDRHGNQNISAIGDHARPKKQLLGLRGGPGNTVNHRTSYWVPRHSRRVFVNEVDVVSGVGFERARHARLRFHDVHRVVTNLGVLDFGGTGHAPRLVSVHPGVSVDEVVAATSFDLETGATNETRLPNDDELRLLRAVLDPKSLRDKEPLMKTALTELAGVRHPIVRTGMGWVAGPRLVSATAEAGGLGILASATMTYDELEAAIKETRSRTRQPFGVNLRSDAEDAPQRVELLIKKKVRVASFALAPRKEMIVRLKDNGVVVIPSVGAARHAEKVASWGADAVVVQGGEGGGHTGGVATTLLLPSVLDAVDIPVVAAGGFFDGRGLAAALAYGASGIAMGTRFLLTKESTVPGAVKDAYLKCGLARHSCHPKGRRHATSGAAHRTRGRARTVRTGDRVGPSGRQRRTVPAAHRAFVAVTFPRRSRDETRQRPHLVTGRHGRQHTDVAAGGPRRRRHGRGRAGVRAGGWPARRPAGGGGSDRGDRRGRDPDHARPIHPRQPGKCCA